ncbi:MAG TPA: hypothetical protein VI011_08985, partial [Asanoa sp.]
AVVLQHESAAARPAAGGGAGALLAPVPAAARVQVSGPLATAFGHTFLWAAGMAALAIVPAVALLRAERAGRRQSHGSAERKGPVTVAPWDALRRRTESRG